MHNLQLNCFLIGTIYSFQFFLVLVVCIGQLNELLPVSFSNHGGTAPPHVLKNCMQVAVKALEAGVFGAYFNVVTNLEKITDKDFKQQVRIAPAYCSVCPH